MTAAITLTLARLISSCLDQEINQLLDSDRISHKFIMSDLRTNSSRSSEFISNLELLVNLLKTSNFMVNTELIPIQLKKTTILLVSIYGKTARVFSLPAKK